MCAPTLRNTAAHPLPNANLQQTDAAHGLWQQNHENTTGGSSSGFALQQSRVREVSGHQRGGAGSVGAARWASEGDLTSHQSTVWCFVAIRHLLTDQLLQYMSDAHAGAGRYVRGGPRSHLMQGPFRPNV